jgi:hypothetical protein
MIETVPLEQVAEAYARMMEITLHLKLRIFALPQSVAGG